MKIQETIENFLSRINLRLMEEGERKRFDHLLEEKHYLKSTAHPEDTDNVVGTAGEFGMKSPLGYNEAKPGETFIKIGVGKLLREDANEYQFGPPYRVADAIPWTINRDTRRIRFTQKTPVANGWGYEYTNRIELARDAPSFTISHTLANTGDNRILTTYYCHNFVVFDGQQLSPGARVLLPFATTGDVDLLEVAKVTGRTLRLDKPLPPDKALWHEFLDFPAGSGKGEYQLQNPATNSMVTIQPDTVPEKVTFYAIGKALCIEAFISIDLAPGETKTWSSRYVFESIEGGMRDSCTTLLYVHTEHPPTPRPPRLSHLALH